ncbi:MAG: hypothetical protein PHU71_00770 [Candidatus Gracilibacteria bacterium]|nr:hypothetical protein [Candidatus Gracilibacteria bacterium]
MNKEVPEQAGLQPDHLAQIAEAKEVFGTFSGKKLELPHDDVEIPSLNSNKEAIEAVEHCLLYAKGLEDLLIKLEENDLRGVMNAFGFDNILEQMFDRPFNGLKQKNMPLYELQNQSSIAHTPELREAFSKMIDTLKHVSDLIIKREKALRAVYEKVYKRGQRGQSNISLAVIGEGLDEFFSEDYKIVNNIHAIICGVPKWTEQSTREKIKKTV